MTFENVCYFVLGMGTAWWGMARGLMKESYVFQRVMSVSDNYYYLLLKSSHVLTIKYIHI